MKRNLLYLTLLFLIAAVGFIFFAIYPKFTILNGYAAKKACSCCFIANRTLESVQSEDLANSPLNLAQLKLDTINRFVESSVFGLGIQRAYYKGDLGCVLIHGNDDHKHHFVRNKKESVLDTLAWPYGDKPIEYKKSGLDKQLINKAIELAFDKDGEFLKKTRSLIIIKDDSIILEKYAAGFNAHTEVLGWSMTKSLTNALIGILVKDSLLDVKQKALFPEWTDERKEISIDNLLRMSSGLQWNEIYSEIEDATTMLFKAEDMPAYVLNAKLEFEPGTHFEYSSGTTNLLSRLLKNHFKNQKDYLNFPYDRLINKLGMKSMVIETDEAGNYVLSSYAFATPRDWGKLGLLYLHEGIWNGDTLFNKEWLDYSIKPTEASPEGKYGAHLWLNTNHNDITDGPESMFRFSGYEGQYVYIIPTHNMVIVRTGLSKGPPFDMNAVVKLVLEAVEI